MRQKGRMKVLRMNFTVPCVGFLSGYTQIPIIALPKATRIVSPGSVTFSLVSGRDLDKLTNALLKLLQSGY